MLEGKMGAVRRDSPSAGVLRVAVVDDQQAFRDAAAAVVEATDGFELVATLADAATLPEVLDTSRPHLLLLDVRMPGADGAEIARRVVIDRPRIVVVLMSVYSRSEIPHGVLGDRILFVEKENLDTEALHRARRVLDRGEAGEA